MQGIVHRAHHRGGVHCKLESLDGESQGPVCPRDELRAPWVALTVQHTSIDDNNTTLKANQDDKV